MSLLQWWVVFAGQDAHSRSPAHHISNPATTICLYSLGRHLVCQHCTMGSEFTIRGKVTASFINSFSSSHRLRLFLRIARLRLSSPLSGVPKKVNGCRKATKSLTLLGTSCQPRSEIAIIKCACSGSLRHSV